MTTGTEGPTAGRAASQDTDDGAAAAPAPSDADVEDVSATSTAGETSSAAQQPRRRWRPWLRSEAWLAAELAALCGFVFARPILGSFGASPETFIARGADGREVVLFGLIVTLGPILVLTVPAVLLGLLGRRARVLAHHGVLGGLLLLTLLQALNDLTDLTPRVLQVLAVVLAVVLVGVRWRVPAAEVFLRYAGVASAVFLVQFLGFSPAASLVHGGRSTDIDPEVTAAVGDALGEDAPPVVVVMLDALPTSTLMDGEGGIDADAFPNLASLADQATWYRNHTTVAPRTLHALPAFLTGVMPDDDKTPPVASAYSENLFTLLGGVYDVRSHEQITALCPASLCPARSRGVGSLLGDAADLWGKSITPKPGLLLVPGAFEERYEGFARWAGEEDLTPGPGPGLFFYHALLPHGEWEYLPDGRVYEASQPPHGSLLMTWGPLGTEVGLQRHVLQAQAVDGVLGQLFDRMRDAGIYDDALVVVTADHGAAFAPDAPMRAMSQSQFEQIMWVPLLVKSPGQTTAFVDDSDVTNLDVLPLLAEELGIDLEQIGWEVDGAVPGSEAAEGRDPREKRILDWSDAELNVAEGDDTLLLDGREGFARVLRADPIDGSGSLAAWRRTEHGDLLGAEVRDVGVGEPLDIELETTGFDRFDDVALDRPLPLEVFGVSWMPEDEVVAVALNGTVAALTRTVPTPYGVTSVHALLWPEAFVDGANEITFYQVEGPPEDPVLHPLEMVDSLT